MRKLLRRISARRYNNRLKRTIEKVAKRHNLPASLVASIIWKESHGDPLARRYEPDFYLNYIAGKSKRRLSGHWPANRSEATERHERATSWGLMQPLLQVCRELGFRGDAAELFDAETNLDFGCRKLRLCLKREDTAAQAIARYNGNPKLHGPRAYAADVLRIEQSKEYERLWA